MKKRTARKKTSTMFSLLVPPILAILLMLIGIYSLFMHHNVLSYLKKNAATVFHEQVANRTLTVSGEMVSHWSQIQGGVTEVIEHLESIVAGQGAAISDIQTDASLNQQIIEGVMDDIIGTMRTCGATEVFLVLDGKAVRSDEKESLRAGVYLRNNNPDFYSNDNHDLLFERGVPAISKSRKISLDSFWATGFELSDETNPNNSFYHKPFQAAMTSESKDFRNFAYWSYGYPIDSLDKGILSYSVPLITSEGSVIGVMGIGISDEYFGHLIDSRDLGDDGSGAYFLARTTDQIHYEPVVFNGTAYNKKDFLLQNLQISDSAGNRLDYVSLANLPEPLCASVQPLRLYDHNTPFESEQWALIGVRPEKQLFAVYNSAKFMLQMLAVSGIIFGFIGIFLTSRLITKPLRRLMEDLRKSDTHKPIHLQRLNVEELDELVNAIESLSARVAASSSKISTIIQMAESGIGVFEYLKKDEKVFCSRSLYEILQWHPIIDTHEYIDSTLFCERLKVLETLSVFGENNLYELVGEDQTPIWVRMNFIEDEESMIGVVTDVTASILEKHQIEYERDFDILTNLLNLRAFQEQLQLLSEKSEAELKICALVMWDLDNLKYLNDMYGHYTGDGYIIALANCLRNHQSAQVISARRSGDEFYTCLYGFDEKAQIREALKCIWAQIQKSEISLPDGQTYKLRVSAGVAWYPEHSQDFSELIRFADFAMYKVKHSRKGDMEDFDPAVYRADWFLTQGQGDFNALLDNRLVRYAAQPILDVRSGRIFGYEMLMRSEVESFRTPADILRMAHAQSRLYDIEAMTWCESLKTFKQLEEKGLVEHGSRIFVNSISNQMLRHDLITFLEKDFADYLPHVVCEFTEEEQHGTEITTEKLAVLNRWQAMTAIDDYGCGYNGEAILLELNPDIVKIDIGIVRGIDRDENRKRLVRDLIIYAHEREILVLGEGVETSLELKTLICLGIDLVQGYYIAHPSFDAAPPAEAVRQEALECWLTKEKT